MKLFNTKSQQIESLQPNGDEITLCLFGPKPTEALRLNQAYLYCTMDMLVRYLEEMKGWAVTYTQVTAGAGDDGADARRSPKNRRAGRFVEQISSLNVRPPDHSLVSIDNNPGQTIDLCMEGGRSPHGAAQSDLAGDQVMPSRFRLQVAAVDHGEPEDPLWSVRTLSDMLRYFSADAIRIYMAQHHYRSPWTHDELILEKAAQYAEKLEAAMKAISTGDQSLNTTPAQNRFMAAMENDLDTRKAMATLLNLADEILFRAPNGYLIDGAQDSLRQMASVLGLRLDGERPEERVTSDRVDFGQR